MKPQKGHCFKFNYVERENYFLNPFSYNLTYDKLNMADLVMAVYYILKNRTQDIRKEVET